MKLSTIIFCLILSMTSPINLENNIKQEQNILIQKNYVEIKTGYATSNLNIRKKPSVQSEKIGEFKFNKEIKYINYNEDWVQIEYKDQYAYLYKKYISKNKVKFNTYYLPENKGYKSWTNYHMITDISSLEYKLQTEYAYTGNYGIRQVNGRYCCALGYAYVSDSDIGRYFDLVLENGVEIQCVLADLKKREHTDEDNIFTYRNGCASEFQIDLDAVNYNVINMGDVSYCNDNWHSPVDKIIIYDKYIWED